MRSLLVAGMLLASVLPGLAAEKVVMETSLGTVVIELEREKAPLTVTNFLDYVDAGFYDRTVFHRVIAGFMIQGGGFDSELNKKPTKSPIKNEAANGLQNDRGTVAMARTNVVDSATSQFFINLVDNDFLNYRAPNPQGYGYAVFGRVVEGMEVVDKIAAQPTVSKGAQFANLPQPVVEIRSLRRENR